MTDTSTKFYIISGEASGDLHASNLMRAMLEENPTCSFRFWGGDHMIAASKQQGVCVKHIRDLAFMGFAEVAKNIRTIFSNIKFCKKDISTYRPEALILVDYPGFNLRIAKWAKKNGIKVIYYISPQVWAWKKKRVYTIKKVVDSMYVILPFEQDFYRQFGMHVHYVGHPLLDAIESYRSEGVHNLRVNESDRPILALLPGSRKQEIKKLLPIMLKASLQFDSHQVIIAASPHISPEFYRSFLSNNPACSVVYNRTYDILSSADLALVTSGTATLETALFGVPEVVCYIGSPISYAIARRLIKIKYISLVNLIMDREVVKELIQKDCHPTALVQELNLLRSGETKRETMQEDYVELKKKLGDGGASKTLAKSILSEKTAD